MYVLIVLVSMYSKTLKILDTDWAADGIWFFLFGSINTNLIESIDLQPAREKIIIGWF